MLEVAPYELWHSSSVIFRSPRPLWTAIEAMKFAAATMPHKGAGLQVITDFDCQISLGVKMWKCKNFCFARLNA